MLAARCGFPPKLRLRKRREFLVVQNRGRRLSGRHYRFFVYPRDDLGTSSLAGRVRFGITVTRKVGNAVTRNRIKRTLRDGCRRVAELFPPGLDVVIVAHSSAANAASGDALRELTDLARRLGSGSLR